MTKFHHKRSVTYLTCLASGKLNDEYQEFSWSHPIKYHGFCRLLACGILTEVFLLICLCKWQQIYLGLIHNRNLKKILIFGSLILTLAKIILTNFWTWNYTQKIFYGNLLCLKVFELKLKFCCYNLFLWPMANQKWYKHRFDWYMVYHALERHRGAIGSKTWAKTLRKGELWWKMENDCS